MFRCPKCLFLNAGSRPSKCTRCGQKFVYRDTIRCMVDEGNDVFVVNFPTDRGRWNEEESRPNTFVEDAMQDGQSGGGGASASFDDDSDSGSSDSGSSDSGSCDCGGSDD